MTEALTIMSQPVALGWIELYKVFEVVHDSVNAKPALLLTPSQDHGEQLAAGQPFRDPATGYPFGQVRGTQTLAMHDCATVGSYTPADSHASMSLASKNSSAHRSGFGGVFLDRLVRLLGRRVGDPVVPGLGCCPADWPGSQFPQPTIPNTRWTKMRCSCC